MRVGSSLTHRPDVGLGGRYVLDRILGVGGTADVYGGRDLVLGRPVAVKWMRCEAVDDPTERLQAEGLLLARLDHPNLVTVLDTGTEDGRPYLVMELAGRTTLRSVLRDGPLRLTVVAQVGLCVARALTYVHEQNVVHRDVKPGNVLMDGDRRDPGRVWLADLGLARDVKAEHMTMTGVTLGTPAFLSPEQVRGEKVASPSDVWSLGLVLLECLTGRREYEGLPVEAAVARLSRPPQVPETLPPGWSDLLGRMLATEPEGRPEASFVAVVLEELLAQSQAAGGAAEPETVRLRSQAPGGALVTAAWLSRPRRIRAAAGLAATAVAAAVLLPSLAHPNPSTPHRPHSGAGPVAPPSRPSNGPAPVAVTNHVIAAKPAAHPSAASAGVRSGPPRGHGHGAGHDGDHEQDNGHHL